MPEKSRSIFENEVVRLGVVRLGSFLELALWPSLELVP
jgi:hypothetical protein